MFFAAMSKDGTLTCCNGGHNPPFLVSGTTVRRLETGGLICGLFEKATYEEETVQLQPGDVLVMFSDGMSEALNAAGEEFGDHRILECVQRSGQGKPDQGPRVPGADGQGVRGRHGPERRPDGRRRPVRQPA